MPMRFSSIRSRILVCLGWVMIGGLACSPAGYDGSSEDGSTGDGDDGGAGGDEWELEPSCGFRVG